MTVSLFRASWRVVAQPPVLVPAGAAVLLALATTLLLDAGNAHQVRIGAAALLACALAATAEDPAGEVGAASPYPRRVRCGVRLFLGLALVLPVAALSLTLIEHQVGVIRTPGAAVQMLAVLMVGPAIGYAVWAWGDSAQPTYAAMAGVLCLVLAMLLLPTTWSVIKVQPWGPPWEAAMVRWLAMICLGAAIVASAWRDAVAPALRRHVRPILYQVASAPDPRVDPATTTARSYQTERPSARTHGAPSSFRRPISPAAANPNRTRILP